MDLPRRNAIDPKERNILLALDSLSQQSKVRQFLMTRIAEAETKLNDDPGAFFVWQVIPLEVYGNVLPSAILSSWIFIIRAGIPPEPHRHPNSHQRTLSYFGSGDLQVWENEQWEPNKLISSLESPLEKRWVSIPQNTWHRPFVHEDWTVLSFHTASEEEVIEETWTNKQMRRYRPK